MHHGEQFGPLVVTVVDERLMEAAAARGRIGGDVVELERAQHVDHEVGPGPAFGAG